ncbi:tetratricopeptide repeat protein [Bradyrhizobium sp. Tv2a-2]|uniref:tetratricopeptide repeat protein n=1 Tax=Bradyrhizobium sp. Tv2a-2 TaxID=113395 RepID=UPI000406BD9B|nr:tetratricopeptide repeat protein [Bradyrhizobium sp. Tv2a-2]
MNHSDRQAAAGTSPSASGDGRGAAALCVAGFRHFEAGRALDAQLCCQQALAIDPDHADTMHLLGLLSAQATHDDLALEWLSRAIRQRPKPQYLASLGNLLRRQGRHDEALKAFDKAVQLDPTAPQSWRDLASLLIELKRLDEALLVLGELKRLAPEDWDAAMKRASALLQLGRTEDGIACLDQCERLRPNHAPTRCPCARSRRYSTAMPPLSACRRTRGPTTRPFCANAPALAISRNISPTSAQRRR